MNLVELIKAGTLTSILGTSKEEKANQKNKAAATQAQAKAMNDIVSAETSLIALNQQYGDSIKSGDIFQEVSLLNRIAGATEDLALAREVYKVRFGQDAPSIA